MIAFFPTPRRTRKLFFKILVVIIVYLYYNMFFLGNILESIDPRDVLLKKSKLDDNTMRLEILHRKPQQFFFEEPQSMSPHIIKIVNTTCLSMGTKYLDHGHCVCRQGWFSDSCDIPDALFNSKSMTFAEKHQLRLRKESPRRIIYGAPFNLEFNMLEALLNELYDLVDVFIFVESSYTAFGRRKPLRLLQRLHRGYLKQFQDKMMYLFFDHFPTGARKNGWVADSYLRSYIGRHGLTNIHGIKEDDLFIVLDLDEVPSRDTLAFLKFHEGYPEPFGARLRWTVFGFFWQHLPYSEVVLGCTIGLLTNVYSNNTNTIRSGNVDPTLHPKVNNYKQNHQVRLWFLGDVNHFAGWHCSSCFDLEGIRIKFTSAQNGDFPRWGNFHDKMDLNYIRKLVENGKWFDGSPGSFLKANKTDKLYAPQYMLDNVEKYKDMLFNPYEKELSFDPQSSDTPT